MSFIVDYNITKFQINQDSVEVWELLNRYIVQWDGIYCCTWVCFPTVPSYYATFQIKDVLLFDYIGYKRLSENKGFLTSVGTATQTGRENGWMVSIDMFIRLMHPITFFPSLSINVAPKCHFPFNFQIKILILECWWPSFFIFFYLEGHITGKFAIKD